MIRRLTLPFVLVIAGFMAGLVVTGRMRTASDSRASDAPPPAAAPAVEQRGASMPGSAASLATSGGPDFTRIAGQAVRGVANISW